MADINVEEVLGQLTLEEKASLTAGQHSPRLNDQILTGLQEEISGIRTQYHALVYLQYAHLTDPMASVVFNSLTAHQQPACPVERRWEPHSTPI